jgi:hypothetical protein
VQYAPQLPQPSRTIVVPLLAAALGAGVATATFALVNIEDQPSVSLPATQSAPQSDVAAGERSDGGPAEGTAQQIMSPSVTLLGSKASAVASPAPRYDGGPNEGSSAAAMSGTQPPQTGAAASEPRYDGGPNEGASAGAIAQP